MNYGTIVNICFCLYVQLKLWQTHTKQLKTENSERERRGGGCNTKRSKQSKPIPIRFGWVLFPFRPVFPNAFKTIVPSCSRSLRLITERFEFMGQLVLMHIAATQYCFRISHFDKYYMGVRCQLNKTRASHTHTCVRYISRRNEIVSSCCYCCFSFYIMKIVNESIVLQCIRENESGNEQSPSHLAYNIVKEPKHTHTHNPQRVLKTFLGRVTAVFCFVYSTQGMRDTTHTRGRKKTHNPKERAEKCHIPMTNIFYMNQTNRKCQIRVYELEANADNIFCLSKLQYFGRRNGL